MRVRRIPLAWKNLTHDWRRLGVAVGGICFAVVLMFIQRGFQNALFDSQVKLIDDLNEEKSDLIMVSKAKYALPVRRRFDLVRLYQALSAPGVAAANPIYLETNLSMLRKAKAYSHSIRVIGLDPTASLLKTPAVTRWASQLLKPNTALIDAKSKPGKFPFAFDDLERLQKSEAELAGRPVELLGVFEMGTDFATEGTMVMSERNFASYFPFRQPGREPLSLVDLGVLTLEADAQADEVAARLSAMMPDVVVCTRDQFRRREIEFWDTNTPIGTIFAIGTVLGFIVGTIICYQIIYTDIADHMSEFATLKAMGYSNWYFVSLIVSESLYLSLLGFIPGALLSWGLFHVVAGYTGLLMVMTPWSRIFLVLLMTVVMCVTSGLVAMRKLTAADPADLF